MTDEELRMLAFEKQWFRYGGSKDTAIHAQFAYTPTRYYQLLNRLLDREDALLADPITVRRLRRQRDLQALRRARRAIPLQL